MKSIFSLAVLSFVFPDTLSAQSLSVRNLASNDIYTLINGKVIQPSFGYGSVKQLNVADGSMVSAIDAVTKQSLPIVSTCARQSLQRQITFSKAHVCTQSLEVQNMAGSILDQKLDAQIESKMRTFQIDNDYGADILIQQQVPQGKVAISDIVYAARHNQVYGAWTGSRLKAWKVNSDGSLTVPLYFYSTCDAKKTLVGTLTITSATVCEQEVRGLPGPNERIQNQPRASPAPTTTQPKSTQPAYQASNSYVEFTVVNVALGDVTVYSSKTPLGASFSYNTQRKYTLPDGYSITARDSNNQQLSLDNACKGQAPVTAIQLRKTQPCTLSVRVEALDGSRADHSADVNMAEKKVAFQLNNQVNSPVVIEERVPQGKPQVADATWQIGDAKVEFAYSGSTLYAYRQNIDGSRGERLSFYSECESMNRYPSLAVKPNTCRHFIRDPTPPTARTKSMLSADEDAWYQLTEQQDEQADDDAELEEAFKSDALAEDETDDYDPEARFVQDEAEAEDGFEYDSESRYDEDEDEDEDEVEDGYDPESHHLDQDDIGLDNQ